MTTIDILVGENSLISDTFVLFEPLIVSKSPIVGAPHHDKYIFFVFSRAQFMHEFQPYPKLDQQLLSASSGSGKKKRPRPDLHHGEPFRPTYVYEMLTKISSTLSTKV